MAGPRAAGNVAACQSNDGSTTYRCSYDYKNRLTLVENKTTGQYAQVVTCLHDGNNRKVKKDLASGTDVVYIYDGWQCIEEREYISGTWKAKRQFVFGGLYLDEPLLFDKDTDSDGDCTDAGGSTRYMYCQNNNYNVVALTDSTGAVVERVKYDPHGQPTCTRVSDGHTQTASHFDNPWLFQGQRYDTESGLYYSNERYYSPALGRFIQPDPTDYPDGMNRFEYMRSNTLTGVDPYGLQKIELKVKEDESDHGSANLWEMLNYGAKRLWGSAPKVSGNVANLNVWSLAKGIGTCSSNSNFVQAMVLGSGEGTVTLKVTVQYALLAQVSTPGNYGGSAMAQVYVFGLNGETLDYAKTPPTLSQSQPFKMSNVVASVLNGEIKGFPCDGKFRTIASATDVATINPAGPAVAGDPELRAVARKAVVKGQARAVVSVTLE